MGTRHALVADQSGRLDAVLSGLLEDLSRARLAGLIREGAVTVEGAEVRRPAHKVAAGDALVIEVPEAVPDRAVPQDLPLEIVYQDDDVVVVDKRAGMVVHPGAGHPDGTLVNALLHHVGDLSGIGGVLRPGIVHRLDRGTSGLIVVAKNDAAHQALQAQFADRTAGRVYLALVHGSPRTTGGTIDAPIGRHRTQRVRFSSVAPSGEARRAVTHWSVVQRAGALTLVRCKLETGRTHQIRVHLSDAGWPLVGDPLYRKRNTRLPASLREVVDADADRPYLHAWQLGFVHPSSGRPVTFEAALPEDFRRVLEALGVEDPTGRPG